MRTAKAAAFVVGMCLLCSAGPARADVVTWSYEGTIISVIDSSDALDDSVFVGAPFSLALSYNTTPQYSYVYADSADYHYTLEAPDGMSMSVTVGGYTFSSQKPPGTDTIYIHDDAFLPSPKDSYYIIVRDPSCVRLPGWDGRMEFYLSTEDLSAITTMDLPLTAPALDKFTTRELAIGFGARLFDIVGRVGAPVKLYEVPDVVGLSIEQAETLIGAAGLNLGYIYDDSAEPRDTVISQEQEPGTVLWADATVSLVVSNGSRARASGGLVAYWKLDEIAGTTAADSSGHGYDGVLSGGPVWQPTGGQIGGALLFDGANDFIDCNNPAALDIRDQITLTCWIKTPAFTRAWQALVTKGDDSYKLCRAVMGDSVYLGLGGTSVGGFESAAQVADNEWHHIAGVYDGSEASLYVDGVLDTAVPATGQINSSSHKLLIGENAQARGRYFKGLMDEIRVYNVALNESSVVKAMQGIVEATTVPIAHWKLDETSGTTASDSAGDHDGTVKGNPLWLPDGGMLDGALQLDGDGDYVEILDHADFDLTTQMTVSAWILVDTFDRQWHAIVTKGDSAWRLHRYRASNTIGFHYTRPGTTYAAANGVRSVKDGEWHHVAGTCDGSTICLYIDGTLDAFSATSGPMATNSYPVMIGENAEQRSRYWHGLIDDVRLYDVALDAPGIQECMLDGAPSGAETVAVENFGF
ncbi:MAG: LamG-like jellyroll fold domain-containing protein [Phycisphaerales bacterium]